MHLPAWDNYYTPAELRCVLDEYASVGEEQLRQNLAYFLERVVPVAASVGIRMAIHPDDPSSVFHGL